MGSDAFNKQFFSKELVMAQILSASGEAVMKHTFIALIAAAAVLSASTAMAQTAREVLGPAAVVPLAEQPPAKIIVDPPLAESLANRSSTSQFETMLRRCEGV
jgi:hypothetical protein